MSFNVRRMLAQAAVSGNFNTIGAGTFVGLSAVPNMNDVTYGSLACNASLLADTNTITLSGYWQVSVDNSTWLVCAPTPGSPLVAAVWATGTAGADTAVQRVIEAPLGVYCYPYVRFAVLVGVTTGAAIDTYATSLSWLRPAFT